MGRDRIVIIGAGDYGRSALEISLALNRNGAEFEVVGFLDDAVASKHEVAGIPVLGNMEWAIQHPDVSYVLGVANPSDKRAILERLRSHALQFLTLVHPRAMVLDSVRLGRGTVVNAGALVVHDAIIGEFASVNLNATIGHDCVVEDFATVSPGANIAGRAKIGTGALIGLNAAILQDVTVGPWATVGAGAVVMRDVPARTAVFGNPARVVDRKEK